MEIKDQVRKLRESTGMKRKKICKYFGQGDLEMLYSSSKRVDSERMSAEIINLKDRIHSVVE